MEGSATSCRPILYPAVLRRRRRSVTRRSSPSPGAATRDAYLPLNDAEIVVRAIDQDAQADDNGGAQ
jgi:hypothetical protein